MRTKPEMAGRVVRSTFHPTPWMPKHGDREPGWYEINREDDDALRRDVVRRDLDVFLDGYHKFQNALQNTYDFSHWVTWQVPFHFMMHAFWAHDEAKGELIVFGWKDLVKRYPIVPPKSGGEGPDSIGAGVQNERYHLFQIMDGVSQKIAVLGQHERLPHFTESRNERLLTTPVSAVTGIVHIAEMRDGTQIWRLPEPMDPDPKPWDWGQDDYIQGQGDMLEMDSLDAEQCQEVDDELVLLKMLAARPGTEKKVEWLEDNMPDELGDARRDFDESGKLDSLDELLKQVPADLKDL